MINTDQISFSNLFSIAKKNIRLLLSLLFLSISLCTLLIYILPEKYFSSSSLIPINNSDSSIPQNGLFTSLIGKSGQDITSTALITETLKSRLFFAMALNQDKDFRDIFISEFSLYEKSDFFDDFAPDADKDDTHLYSWHGFNLAYDFYIRSIIINVDQLTSLIRVKYIGSSPEVAQQAHKHLLDLLDFSIREAEKIESILKIQFLEEKTSSPNISTELLKSLNTNIVNEISYLSGLETRVYFAFKFLEKPTIIRKIYSPDPFLYYSLSILISLFIYIFIITSKLIPINFISNASNRS